MLELSAENPDVHLSKFWSFSVHLFGVSGNCLQVLKPAKIESMEKAGLVLEFKLIFRKIYLQREGDGTACAAVSQLQNRLCVQLRKFSIHNKQPSLHRDHNQSKEIYLLVSNATEKIFFTGKITMAAVEVKNNRSEIKELS